MTRFKVSFVILTVLVVKVFGSGRGRNLFSDKEWCYGDSKECGESTWPGYCNEGTRYSQQSPIDLPLMGSLKIHKGLENFNKKGFNMKRYRLINDERTLEILPVGKVKPFTINVPFFEANFSFEKLHFHWGLENKTGSEHSIEEKGYGGEVQFEFYKSAKFKSVYEASIYGEQKNSILIISAFLNPSWKSNLFKKLADHIPTEPRIVDVNENLDLSQLFQADKAYVYQGSMSYPPCFEKVSHIVLSKPVDVSMKFMKTLRAMQNDDNEEISYNFRKTATSNQRRIIAVKINYKGDDDN